MSSRPGNGVTTMGPGPCFVDLSDDDDDEDLVVLTEFPAHLSHRSSRKPQSETIAFDLVILEGAVDLNPELHFGSRPQKGSRKSSQSSISLIEEDDCCILDEDPSKAGVVTTSCGGHDSDDLVMTGEVGQVACRDFPHARHLCVQFPFKTTPHESFCSQCHCYVCDMVAPCSLWGDGTLGGDHCHASDKIGERWKLLRQYNRSHPTGCSDPSALQLLLSPGQSPAGKSDSGAQRCSYPAGYEHVLVQSKEFISQFFSDLFSPGRESRVSKLFGAFASTVSTKGFSPSPPVTTGNSESTSLRGLLGCQPGDSARSQHPLQRGDSARSQYTLQWGDSARSQYPLQLGDAARTQHSLQRSDSARSEHPLQRSDCARSQYPLQISLNHPNRESRSHPRRHQSQVLGVRAAKFHRYVHRKSPHYSSTYLSYQPEAGGGLHPTRTSQKNGSFSSHPAHLYSNPGSAPRPQASISAVLPRRPTPTAATVERESFGCMDPTGDTVSSKDFLGELAAAQAFFASCSADRPEDQRQQCLNTDTPSAPSFGSAPLVSQNEIGAYNSQGNGTVGSCNSKLLDTQLSGESISDSKVEGSMDSLPTSPSTLLVDYLLNGDDFWNDCNLPENFVDSSVDVLRL